MRAGGAGVVVRRAIRAGVVCTIVSALAALRRGRAAVLDGNQDALQVCRRYRSLRMWAVLNPRHAASFRQVAAILRDPACRGIKIHPAEHAWPFRRYGAQVLAFAAEHGAVVLTHSGSIESRPGDVADVVVRFPHVAVILAHLGNSNRVRRYDEQVAAILGAPEARLYVDTSSCLSICSGLIEMAADALPADRILFGSDSPLYCVHSQRARIEGAEIPPAMKRRILRDNALALFPAEARWQPRSGSRAREHQRRILTHASS